jgi:hypothetical protein
MILRSTVMPPASITTKKAAPIKGAEIKKKNKSWALDWELPPASKYIMAIADPSFPDAVCSHLLWAISRLEEWYPGNPLVNYDRTERGDKSGRS